MGWRVQECSQFGAILKQSTHKNPHTADRRLSLRKKPLRAVNHSFLACIGVLTRRDNMNAGTDYGIHLMMVIRFRHGHNSAWIGIAHGFGFSSFASNERT